jgi:hypothetical protein
MTYHWIKAAHVPVKFRTAPGKISADTIHGMPFRPNDQLPHKISTPPIWQKVSVDAYKTE